MKRFLLGLVMGFTVGVLTSAVAILDTWFSWHNWSQLDWESATSESE